MISRVILLKINQYNKVCSCLVKSLEGINKLNREGQEPPVVCIQLLFFNAFVYNVCLIKKIISTCLIACKIYSCTLYCIYDVEEICFNTKPILFQPPENHLHHGEIIGYYIGYRIRNSTEPFHYKTFEVIPGVDLQITLTNLQKFTEYSILVQAYNRAGAGPRSQEVVASTDEDGKH